MPIKKKVISSNKDKISSKKNNLVVGTKDNNDENDDEVSNESETYSSDVMESGDENTGTSDGDDADDQEDQEDQEEQSDLVEPEEPEENEEPEEEEEEEEEPDEVEDKADEEEDEDEDIGTVPDTETANTTKNRKSTRKDPNCLYNALSSDDDQDRGDDLIFDDDNDDYVTHIVSKEKRMTKPRLTKYEEVRLLGDRTQQLTLGAKPMIKKIEGLSAVEIAKLEIKENKIPIIIERPLPNGNKERWHISELAH